MIDKLLKLLGIARAGSPDPHAQPYGDVPGMPAPIEAPKPYIPPVAPPIAPLKPIAAPPAASIAKPKGKKTLASVVGVATAAALLTAVPAEESGRQVEVTIEEPDQAPIVRHVSGKQYLKAYLDIVGVATACDGITKGVRMGQTYTEAQCTELLERELIVHAEGVMKCTPGLALDTGRDKERFAAVSLAYNVGVGRYCKSTAMRRFNAGRYAEGCDALLMFNKAGGRVVRGLRLRRERERRVCLKGF
jgi:lysozyme